MQGWQLRHPGDEVMEFVSVHKSVVGLLRKRWKLKYPTSECPPPLQKKKETKTQTISVKMLKYRTHFLVTAKDTFLHTQWLITKCKWCWCLLNSENRSVVFVSSKWGCFFLMLFLIMQATMQTTLPIANLLTSLQFARVQVLLDAAMTTVMIQAAAGWHFAVGG